MRFGGTVELHLHMDICMSFEAVASLDPIVDADTYRREFVGPRRFDSFTAFLASTERHVDLLQTEQGLRTCMRDLRGQLAADNALHAEPRFAPLRHIEGDVTSREVCEIVVEEARAWQQDGLSCAVILCALRHYTEAQSIETAQLCTALHTDDLPVAFDLAGDEAAYPLTTHLPAFEIVRGVDGPFTVHAGEAAGPDSVREVLDHLEPRRISHGIRAVEDPTSSHAWCARACTSRPARHPTFRSVSWPPWPSTRSERSRMRAYRSGSRPTSEPSPTRPSPLRCATWPVRSGGIE